MLTSTAISAQYSSLDTEKKDPKKELDKDDFLNLMVTQLKNQDPLNPMDNNEFINQTTQFSSLEQLINIGENIKAMAENQSQNSPSESLYSASNFIGKELKYFTDSLKLEDDGALIGYELDDIPESVQIEIIDSSGNPVAEVVPNGFNYGVNEIQWDGLDANGEKLPNGYYSFVVYATDASGNQIPYRSYTSGIAKGITMLDGNLKFDVNGIEITSDNIFSVYENN